jgi:membrane associated rhomboid family serine protease
MLTKSIADDINHHFRYGGMVVKLIWINIAVFLFVNLFYVVFSLAHYNALAEMPYNLLSIPLNFTSFLTKPWTILTYMFMHDGVMHILFNMLWFYWFGDVFVTYLNEKKILPLYFIGGIAGAALALLAVNLIPALEAYKSQPMVGASASVIAIVFASATINPEHRFNLMFIGAVPLKYVAVVPLLIDIISIPKGNAGGYIAHVGGALAGYLYVKSLQRGFDITGLFKRKSKVKMTYKNEEPNTTSSTRSKTEQQRVDEILDKIARSGYDSLTKEEKDFLFNYSKKS